MLTQSFIVTKDNPHYPSVTYCNTLEEAQLIRDEYINDNFSTNGHYPCNVTIAQVIETVSGHSDY